MAAAGESSVIRLIYIDEYLDVRSRSPAGQHHLDVEIGDDGTIRLVANWVARRPRCGIVDRESADYFHRVGRRPSSLATLTDPQTAADGRPSHYRPNRSRRSSVRWRPPVGPRPLRRHPIHSVGPLHHFRHPRAVADLVPEPFARNELTATKHESPASAHDQTLQGFVPPHHGRHPTRDRTGSPLFLAGDDPRLHVQPRHLPIRPEIINPQPPLQPLHQALPPGRQAYR